METTRGFKNVLTRHGIDLDEKQIQMWATMPRPSVNRKSLRPPAAITDGGLTIRRKDFPRLDVTFGTKTRAESVLLEPLGQEHDHGGGGAWPTHWEYLLTMISLGLGVSNLWRLPTLVVVHGGGLLFAWLLMMAVMGLPLLFIQTGLGSFSGKTCVGIWKAVPLLKGVGFCQVWIGLLLSWYFPTIGSFASYYIIEAMTSSNTDPAFSKCLDTSLNNTIHTCKVRPPFFLIYHPLLPFISLHGAYLCATPIILYLCINQFIRINQFPTAGLTQGWVKSFFPF